MILLDLTECLTPFEEMFYAEHKHDEPSDFKDWLKIYGGRLQESDNRFVYNVVFENPEDEVVFRLRFGVNIV